MPSLEECCTPLKACSYAFTSLETYFATNKPHNVCLLNVFFLYFFGRSKVADVCNLLDKRKYMYQINQLI